jgi:GNAT superfamily N-acetyltransferase
MTEADLPLGLMLCRQAGWNQIELDWRRFLAMEPEGCFVAELDGLPVATTTTCIFGPVAWIAMVLVERNARRRGIATALLTHALCFLDEQGARTVRLDATAAGQPVYEKLGFAPEYALTRYEGIAQRIDAVLPVAGMTADLLDELVTFDRRMTGAHREKMLTRLFEESLETMRVVCRGRQLEGYATARRGENATQVGPCIATAHAGPSLLADALSRCAGRPVFIDIPRDNAGATQIAEMAGLKAQRHFKRMHRGDPVADCVEAIWAASGPEKG